MSTLDEDQMNKLAAALAAGDITYTGEPVTELPPVHDGTEVMAVYSMRLSADTAQRLARVAEAKGVKPSTLMREYVETCLATEEDDRPISLTDAMRALAQLRKAA